MIQDVKKIPAEHKWEHILSDYHNFITAVEENKDRNKGQYSQFICLMLDFTGPRKIPKFIDRINKKSEGGIRIKQERLAYWSHYENKLSEFNVTKLCHGIVTKDLLYFLHGTLQYSHNFIDSEVGNSLFNFFDLFPILEHACYEMEFSTLPYKVMELWSLKLDQLVTSDEWKFESIDGQKFKYLFSDQYKYPGRIFHFLYSRWENSVRGIV